MADELEDPDAAADRLEAALERIARLAAVAPPPVSAQSDAELSIPEIAERLDHLIGRLRAALGKPESGKPESGEPESGEPELGKPEQGE